MPFCPDCGKEVLPEDRFCFNCGRNLTWAGTETTSAGEPTLQVMGVSSNSAYYVTREGLLGVKVVSSLGVVFCALLPLPVLAILSLTLQPASAAVYITMWLAMLLLVYDEAKSRGLRRLKGLTIEQLTVRRTLWRIPWKSIRKANWDGSTLATSSPDRLRTTIAFEGADYLAVETNLTAWGVPVRRKPTGKPSNRFGSFLALVLILFVISQAILISAAVLPFFPGEEQIYASTLNQVQGQVTNTTLVQQFELIFGNNVQIATANMLPGLGALTFGAASYNTGRVIQVIGLQRNIPPILIVISLYLYPHSWIEELSYPIATAAGIMMLTTWRRPSPMSARRTSRGSVKFALALGAVAIQLTVAGFFEVVEPGLGAYALLLWVPIAVAVVLLLLMAVRRLPDNRPMNSSV